MSEIKADAEWMLFKSIVDSLNKHLFKDTFIEGKPVTSSDIETVTSILNGPDMKKFFNEDFIKTMSDKLQFKADGLIKQADAERSLLSKFAKKELE